MLPQCDPAILNDNPQFKILHQQLTATILKPDGSTRALEAEPSRRQVQAELKKYQIRAAKRRVLKRIVCQLPYDLGNGLPDELRDLVAIIALYLDGPTTPRANGAGNGNQSSDGANDDAQDDILTLLESDLDAFRSQLPNLLPAIRNALTSDLTHLKTLANATSSNDASSKPDQSRIPQHAQRADSRLRPLSLKPTLSSTSSSSSAITVAATANQSLLSTQLSNRLHALRTLQSVELLTAQGQLAITGAEVLSAHTQVMERMIQVLERTKYGSLARAGKARAEYLAAVSEGLDGKIKVMQRDILSSIYTPETIDALHNYRKHLHDTRVRLEERRRKAMQELGIYEDADSSKARDDSGTNRAGAMVDVAKGYGSLVKEVESVRMEIKRLGGNM